MPDEEPSFIYMVGRVNQGIRREMRARLSRCELSVAEYTTLSVLAARPELSNAQLARRALVTPQSMIEILAQLEQRDLVQRRVDPDHGRILRATLTPKGHEVLAIATPEVAALNEAVFAGMPAGQRRAAQTAMRVAMENLSSS